MPLGEENKLKPHQGVFLFVEKFIHLDKPTKHQEMKKPQTLDDYKAYAFGITWVVLTLLAPFAIMKLLSYVF